MFKIGDYVQITNHSEPACNGMYMPFNGMYGNVTKVTMAYDGTLYFMVVLENGNLCDCTADEVMEG